MYFTDVHSTGTGPQRQPGIFSTSAYPTGYSIGMDPHEDLVVAGLFGWISEPVLKQVEEYLASVKISKPPLRPTPRSFKVLALRKQAVLLSGQVLIVQGRQTEAEKHKQTAELAFEALLDRYLLAFADHGAEFYAASGRNWHRALELARVNVANRPTLRAFEQAFDIAARAGNRNAACELFTQAKERWQETVAFSSSPIVRCSKTWKGATA
jgi:hypothetical protein